ncbi:MAG TPA: hypothetical protein VHF67_12765, partial [Gaiellaceae bacterium]|nr:hypothetical protein [Gaiellaceae bacterium]
AALGVRYVVVVADAATESWEPRADERFDGLQVMRRTNEGTVFRVTADPAPGVVLVRHGFWPPEGIAGASLRWMSTDGRVEVRGNCNRCVGEIRMTAASFAQPRMLTVRDDAGKVIARRGIGIAMTKVSIPIRFEHRADLYFDTRPGPQSIAEATGIPDPRSVSIQVAVPITFASSPNP